MSFNGLAGSGKCIASDHSSECHNLFANRPSSVCCVALLCKPVPQVETSAFWSSFLPGLSPGGIQLKLFFPFFSLSWPQLQLILWQSIDRKIPNPTRCIWMNEFMKFPDRDFIIYWMEGGKKKRKSQAEALLILQSALCGPAVGHKSIQWWQRSAVCLTCRTHSRPHLALGRRSHSLRLFPPNQKKHTHLTVRVNTPLPGAPSLLLSLPGHFLLFHFLVHNLGSALRCRQNLRSAE